MKKIRGDEHVTIIHRHWILYKLRKIISFIICLIEKYERYYVVMDTANYRSVMEQAWNGSFHMNWSMRDELLKEWVAVGYRQWHFSGTWMFVNKCYTSAFSIVIFMWLYEYKKNPSIFNIFIQIFLLSSKDVKSK
jgi:hypothetical protein